MNLGWKLALPRAATREELAGYEAPTLLFAAENDLFFPAEKVIPRAREIIPNLETETLSGSRHVEASLGQDQRPHRRVSGTFLREMRATPAG